MKKLYIKPNLKVVSIMPHNFIAASQELFQYAGNGSRKVDSWDEDEDETEDSMWK